MVKGLLLQAAGLGVCALPAACGAPSRLPHGPGGGHLGGRVCISVQVWPPVSQLDP